MYVAGNLFRGKIGRIRETIRDETIGRTFFWRITKISSRGRNVFEHIRCSIAAQRRSFYHSACASGMQFAAVDAVILIAHTVYIRRVCGCVRSLAIPLRVLLFFYLFSYH